MAGLSMKDINEIEERRDIGYIHSLMPLLRNLLTESPEYSPLECSRDIVDLLKKRKAIKQAVKCVFREVVVCYKPKDFDPDYGDGKTKFRKEDLEIHIPLNDFWEKITNKVIKALEGI